MGISFITEEIWRGVFFCREAVTAVRFRSGTDAGSVR